MKPFQLLALIAVLLCGCAPKADNTLGDYQYLGLVPKLQIRILKRQIATTPHELESTEMQITGTVQQIEEFPVAAYDVRFLLKVYDGEKLIDQATVNAAVKNKAGAFTVIVNVGATGDRATLKLEKFDWSPIRDYQSKVTFEDLK